MKRSPSSAHNLQMPKLAWLEITELLLKVACDLFALSQKLDRSRILEWVGMRLLRMAARTLGHAPAESHLEFRPDIPVQI